jgi:dolichol-phosphate mannosyltransferase
MAADRRLISVIIPVYNEEENVLLAYEAVRAVFESKLQAYDFEIVFTDNHSEDATFSEIRKIADRDSRVRAVRFTRNFGFNKSLLTGYRLAKGAAAIQVDCDLQDPPAIFPEFIRRWEQGHDVVVGVRNQRPEARWLLALRKTFYRMLKLISEDNVVLDGGDFRLVDRSVLDQLKVIHDSSPYVRGLVSTVSANLSEFSYERTTRKFGKSKFPLLKLVTLAIEGIVSHSTLPLRLASLVGFVVFAATLLLAAWYTIDRLMLPEASMWPAGFATTVILQLLSISLNAIFLGVIGEYVGRIYQQARVRPITVVEAALNMDEPVKTIAA